MKTIVNTNLFLFFCLLGLISSAYCIKLKVGSGSSDGGVYEEVIY